MSRKVVDTIIEINQADSKQVCWCCSKKADFALSLGCHVSYKDSYGDDNGTTRIKQIDLCHSCGQRISEEVLK